MLFGAEAEVSCKIVQSKGSNRYIRRNRFRQFKKEVSVGRPRAANRRRHAKKKVPKGQGDRGDTQKAVRVASHRSFSGLKRYGLRCWPPPVLGTKCPFSRTRRWRSRSCLSRFFSDAKPSQWRLLSELAIWRGIDEAGWS